MIPFDDTIRIHDRIMQLLNMAMYDHSFRVVSSLQKVGALLAILSVITAGCAMLKLKEEVSESLASTVLVGQVASAVAGKGVIVVAAYSLKDGERKIAHYTVLHEAGEYELMVAAGNYYVCAYWDQNSNLVYDAGEPAGQYGKPKLVAAPAGGVVLEINFGIAEKGSPIDLPRGFEISPDKPRTLHSRQAGAVVALNDERFSAENGSKGFWEPHDFFKTIGGNIYFLEKYDPEKIPILFIHGAAGTPKGWECFINHLDRKRFQPWLFYYPTGSRLKGMSYLLFWKLYNLQIKYKFDTLFITAHSMGGLVARSFIMDYGRYTPYVKLFIALATPWGGDRMAEYGVKQSPAVIPSWIDMQPEGNFLQSLYREKLPPTVSFYMFTGHRGSRNPFRSNNDGTITLASLMDLRPQAEAKMNYVFNEDHASILSSPAVLAQYNAIINAFDSDTRVNQIAGGYIKIDFTYDYPLDGSWPRVILVLLPDGHGAAATEIHLSPEDSGRLIGPFPIGDYTASLMASAVKPDKHHVPVTIESNGTQRLKFSLTPDGMIYGHVAAAQDAEDRPAGMPAEQYLPGSREVTIQTVTLKGASVERILHPAGGENLNHYDDFLSSTDFCTNNYFHFFGLPAGEYEVKITAEGFEPGLKTYSVKPGRPENIRAIELVPEKEVTQ
ncbi:MAG: alpha/beta hydrolase [Desulfobacterales bacterium]